MEKLPCVYIMASKRNGTLYIGVTSNLCKRVSEHRLGIQKGFTSQHNIKLLVWYEQHGTMESAIAREKQLKKWKRDWKIRLIMKDNCEWKDLFEEICGQ